MIYSQDWLRANVGAPSNQTGSTYSAIFKLAGDYHEKQNLDVLDKLIEKVNAFTWSQHRGAKTAAAQEAKTLQALSLDEFCASVKLERLEKSGQRASYRPEKLARMIAKGNSKYEAELAMVKQAVNDMADSANLLIRNSGIGLRGMRIQMMLDDGTNGQIALNGLVSINAIIAYNKVRLVGTLVHEYHHYLCGHLGVNDTKYVDEFVAHYKEFTLTKQAMTDAERCKAVNEALTRNYGSIVKAWQRHHQLITTFDQVGDFAIPDNAGGKIAPHQHLALSV